LRKNGEEAGGRARKSTESDDDDVVASNSDEVIIDDESEDNPFAEEDTNRRSGSLKSKLKLLQPWQVKPFEVPASQSKKLAPKSPSHRLVCLSGFSYPRSLYNERKMLPLLEENEEVMECSALFCKEPAYFYCNRNTCSTHWGK